MPWPASPVVVATARSDGFRRRLWLVLLGVGRGSFRCDVADAIEMADLFVFCEPDFEPGERELCDELAALSDRPIARLREYLAEHPELGDAASDRLQGVPLN